MSGRSASKVGARIRRLRNSKGLSQREVAEPVMTGAYLSLVEAGQRAPSLPMLDHIASRLGVDVEEITIGRPSGIQSDLEMSLQESRQKLHRGDSVEAEEELRDIASQAQRFDLPDLEARALVLLATAHEQRGDTSTARDLFDEVQGMLADAPAHVRFEAVVGFARCTAFLEDPRLAAHLLEMYLIELARNGVEDPTAKMRVLSTLVYLYKMLGLERRSIEIAEEAVRLAPNVDDPEQVACMSINVARSLMEQGRHDDAVGMLRKAEQVYQSLDWPLSVVRARTNRAIVELDKGKLNAAYDSFSAIVATLQDHPTETAELGAVLNYLGRVERMRGNDHEALRHLKRARKLLPEDDAYEHAMNAREMGLTLAASDRGASVRELKKASAAYRAVGAASDAATVMLELGRLLLADGDTEKAARVFEEGLALASTVSSA